MSGFIAFDSLVISMNADRSISALDLHTGNEIFRDYIDFGCLAAPVADGGRIFFGSDRATIVCYDAVARDTVWTRRLWGDATNSLTLGEHLYFGSDKSNYYALDKSTGKTEWEKEITVRCAAPASIADGALFVASVDGRTRKMSCSSGEIFWYTPEGKWGDEVTPLVIDNEFVVYKYNDESIAISEMKKWESRYALPGNDIEARSIIKNGSTVYYFSESDAPGVCEIRRADIAKGYMLRPHAIPCDTISRPLIHRGYIYYLAGGKLWRIKDIDGAAPEELFDFSAKSCGLKMYDTDRPTLMKIAKNIEYPEFAQKQNIAGLVSIVLLVEPDGGVLAEYVERSPHPLLTDEVKEAIAAAELGPFDFEEARWIRIKIPFRIR
ncbi:MAG: PQQ-binding-like beta-propeller repeat protein [Candidatus Kapaibacterium sp.]